MWNSENWKNFLSTTCIDYPNDDIAADANYLAEQKLGPSRFNTLIQIYDQEGSHRFKQHFPNFTLGNMIGLIDGLKIFVCEQETSSKNTVAAKCFAGPPSKKIRIDQNALNTTWFNNVKKYMHYFLREGAKENFPRRCVCVVSPTIAVTFAHGKNKYFKLRVTDCKGNLIERGTILQLYSLYNSQDHQITAEVISVNNYVDFILVEALDGKTFFEGNELEHILEDPVTSMRLLAIGLSSDTPSQEAVTTGVVLSTGPFYDHQMVSDIISWNGDSGGGLFSSNNKLLGIVSASQKSDEGEWTRTYFAPATEIKAAWEKWMVESGKKTKPRRSKE